MGRIAAMAVLEPRIALSDHTTILIVGMPYLATMHPPTAGTEDGSREAACAIVLIASSLAPCQLLLHHVEHLCVDDGRMAVLHIILLHLALVDLHLLGKKIQAKGLLANHIGFDIIRSLLQELALSSEDYVIIGAHRNCVR